MWILSQATSSGTVTVEQWAIILVVAVVMYGVGWLALHCVGKVKSKREKDKK